MRESVVNDLRWAIDCFPYEEPVIDTCAEREEKLSFLIENPQRREQMGREGRKRVLEKRTFQACAPRLFSILNRVVNGVKRIQHAV